MDLRKEGHHGEENDEIYLVVVVLMPERDGLAGKARRRVRRKPSFFKLRGYEWRLEKRAVLLESSRRGLHRHMYIYAGF